LPSRSPSGRTISLLAAAAVAALAAACSTPAPNTFDLAAPSDIKPVRGGAAQLVVGVPSALGIVDTDRIMVRARNGEVSYLPNAQWTDRVPGLVQTRLIQTFENAKRGAYVSRPDDRVTADAMLVSEVRTFEIDASGAPAAAVAVSAKLVSLQTGRITAAKLFESRVAAAGVNALQATSALDQALQDVLRDIVQWASARAGA
jgi:cholesterol transport system auxiliary component